MSAGRDWDSFEAGGVPSTWAEEAREKGGTGGRDGGVAGGGGAFSLSMD